MPNHHDPIPVASPTGEACMNLWGLEEIEKKSSSAKAYGYESHERGLPSPNGEGQGERKNS